MARGGKRPGGGRPRGAKDKGKAAIAALAALKGETPIALWARVMSDPEASLELRLSVARDFAPYLHAKPKQEHGITVHEGDIDLIERIRAERNGVSANGQAHS